MINEAEIAEELETAKAIAWDTCHKIYILMDDEQVDQMRDYKYDPLITADEMTPQQMLKEIKEWYDVSCGLRFISSVTTNHKNPNAGFKQLIGQFEDQEVDA